MTGGLGREARWSSPPKSHRVVEETLRLLRERMAVQPYPLQKMRFAAAMAYIIAYLFRSFSEGRVGVHD